MVENGCPFCLPDVSRFSHFEQYGRDQLDCYPIATTENFLVRPDVLPGNPDGRHMLVFPKRHVYNHASLTGGYSDEVGRLVYSLEERFGPLVIFEHGGLKPGGKIQSIYHAHFHVYGGLENVDIIRYMEDMLSGGLGSNEIYSYEVAPAPNYTFLDNLAGKFNGHPYLYIEQGPRAIIAHDPHETMQSRIAQRSMNLFFSREDLDWKKVSTKDEFAKESVRRIANLIGRCEHGVYNLYGF